MGTIQLSVEPEVMKEDIPEKNAGWTSQGLTEEEEFAAYDELERQRSMLRNMDVATKKVFGEVEKSLDEWRPFLPNDNISRGDRNYPEPRVDPKEDALLSPVLATTSHIYSLYGVYPYKIGWAKRLAAW